MMQIVILAYDQLPVCIVFACMLLCPSVLTKSRGILAARRVEVVSRLC